MSLDLVLYQTAQHAASRGKFDPEGSGYDMETALAFGMRPHKSGHWYSRAPNGQILKGKGHETFHKTIAGEKKAGYIIKKMANGRYYSFTKKEWDEIKKEKKRQYTNAVKNKK